MSTPPSLSRLSPAVAAALSATLLVAACAAPARPPAAGRALVATGLDRLAAGEELEPFAGRRIGLVVHRASVTADGRHAIDALRARGLDVVRLFSPEHGLRGEAAAGEAVGDGVDARSGLPVVSLYGERRRPAAEDLADLDVLVVDLQGGGVRFYTYVSTLILCLDAAAESGVELVVLDRPNPLGGERIEGPVSAPRERVAASFVNLAPGPLVHGLTLGEMALYVNGERAAAARVRVVAMRGWRREMTWADTGLPWVPPSPNLRSAEAALAYPGTALLEATNVSEGRGTTDPFLLVGAPWLDPGEIAVETPGFRLRPTRFTPVSSPAAPSPKYAGEECAGWRVEVTDRRAAEPYRLGVSLLVALSARRELAWRGGGEALTRLLGSARVIEALRAGAAVEEIVLADAGDHAAWRAARAHVLLYESR